MLSKIKLAPWTVVHKHYEIIKIIIFLLRNLYMHMHEYTHTILQHFSFMFLQQHRINISFCGGLEGNILS